MGKINNKTDNKKRKIDLRTVHSFVLYLFNYVLDLEGK